MLPFFFFLLWSKCCNTFIWLCFNGCFIHIFFLLSFIFYSLQMTVRQSIQHGLEWGFLMTLRKGAVLKNNNCFSKLYPGMSNTAVQLHNTILWNLNLSRSVSNCPWIYLLQIQWLMDGLGSMESIDWRNIAIAKFIAIWYLY